MPASPFPRPSCRAPGCAARATRAGPWCPCGSGAGASGQFRARPLVLFPMKTLRTTLATTVAAALLAPAAHAAPTSICNAPIQMSDGGTLRANVFLPRADGRFPVVLTVTGYNKDTNNPFGLNCSSDSALASGNQKLLDN